ncbi:MAG: rhamnulokinase [Anaerolinea sp.]|nr:rhamnulokinase [Anaerolinea sp.]
MKKNTAPTFLALDLGAESGRAILGCLDSKKLKLQEIHRFINIPVKEDNSLHWDVMRLWSEMKQGLAAAIKETNGSLISLGVDTWGVDFGLLDSKGSLLGNPFHYRDRRTDGMVDAAFKKVSQREIYEQTGNQIMAINSLYQLLSMVKNNSLLRNADRFLNIPDLFNYWFSGIKASELTIASTTQCFNPRTRNWANGLLNKLDIPLNFFGEIIQPGTELGRIKSEILGDIGSSNIKVVAVASHDTQSAIMAVPSLTDDFIFLSSGTWSLMGVEVLSPVINDEGLANDFSNECSYGGKTCLLKNIVGLWILQECKREWAEDGYHYSYDDLTKMAETAVQFSSYINPADSVFLPSGKMVDRIQSFCKRTKQWIPQTHAEIVRCILESLALEYRRVADQISTLLKHDFHLIHVIGGGSQNKLLNQLTANSTGRTVIAGPVEATAIGNILSQAISASVITNLDEGRELVSHSFENKVFEPESISLWNEAYHKYLSLTLEADYEHEIP